VILRGKGGHFCAGGDIKDMAALRVEAANVGSLQPYVDFNRRFGAMIEQVDQAPQTVVAVLEGAVLVVVLAWLVFLILRLVLPMPNLAYLKQA
jgi:isohexenylglutaconyl-CoA hydratase